MAKWFKRDPNDEPQRPLPRWMAWLLFGFIGYLVIVGNVSTMHPPESVLDEPRASAEATNKQDFPAIRRTFSLSNWQRAFDPTLSEGLKIRDFTQGAGRQVACGDEVTIKLRGRDTKGQKFDPEFDEDKALTFIIGKKQTYPAVEQSMVGMRQGGERIIDAPPVLVYDKEEVARDLSTLTMQVQLEKLEPVLLDNNAPLLIATNRIPEKSREAGAQCGDTIEVSVSVWDERGEKPSKLKNTHLTLGARELALGIDHALPGILADETRTLLLPPPYQQHDGNDSPFDGKALRLVEVTRLK